MREVDWQLITPLLSLYQTKSQTLLRLAMALQTSRSTASKHPMDTTFSLSMPASTCRSQGLPFNSSIADYISFASPFTATLLISLKSTLKHQSSPSSPSPQKSMTLNRFNLVKLMLPRPTLLRRHLIPPREVLTLPTQTMRTWMPANRQSRQKMVLSTFKLQVAVFWLQLWPSPLLSLSHSSEHSFITLQQKYIQISTTFNSSPVLIFNCPHYNQINPEDSRSKTML